MLHKTRYTMEYYSAIKKNTFESVLMRWIKLEWTFMGQVSFQFLCRGKGNTLLGKPTVPSKIIPKENIPTQSFMNSHRTPIKCIFTEFLSSYLFFTLENAASVTPF